MALSARAGSSALMRSATKPRAVSRAAVKVQAFQVTLRMPSGKSRVLEMSSDEAIIDAIEREEIDLPNLCRSGACGACAGRLQTGTVSQKGQNILDPDQIKAGFVLLCSSYPQSDCTILTHQEESLHTTAYGKY